MVDSYGHIWVALSLALRHPRWGALALPLRAMLYVRRKTIPKIPKKRNWKFRTKLELAARLLAGGMIRVVIVKEDHGWFAFFSTDPAATVVEILKAFGDFAAEYEFCGDYRETGTGAAAFIFRASDVNHGYMVYCPWGGERNRPLVQDSHALSSFEQRTTRA